MERDELDRQIRVLTPADLDRIESEATPAAGLDWDAPEGTILVLCAAPRHAWRELEDLRRMISSESEPS